MGKRLTLEEIDSEVAVFRDAINLCRNQQHLQEVPSFVWRQFAQALTDARKAKESASGR